MKTTSAASLAQLSCTCAGDLRPPVVQPGEVAHDRAAHHDVVEVRDDEVGVVDVDVDAERRQESPVRPPTRKRPRKPNDEDHRRLRPDRAACRARGPVEVFTADGIATA